MILALAVLRETKKIVSKGLNIDTEFRKAVLNLTHFEREARSKITDLKGKEFETWETKYYWRRLINCLWFKRVKSFALLSLK